MNTINRSQKRLLMLLSILLIIGSIWGLKQISSIHPPTPITLIKSIKGQDVQVIEINNGHGILVLQKKNGQWYQSGAGFQLTADKARVNTLLSNVFSLKRDTLISTNQSRFKDLGVDTQNITLKTPTQADTLYIGTSENPDTVYIRVKDENNTYSVGNILDLFVPFDYRDLNIHAVDDETKVSNITIRHDGISIILQGKNNTWSVDGTNIKKEKVDFLLNDLKTLTSADILKDKPGDMPEEKSLEIQIRESNKDKTITFYKKSETRYYMTVSYTPFMYEISSAYVESFKKEEKDFIE